MPKEESYRYRGKKWQTRVHSFKGAISCRGIGCNIQFVPKRKDQVFCSGVCRRKYFEVARFLGKRILEKRNHDPKLLLMIERLLPGQDVSSGSRGEEEF
jgi:hypothetical protein